jgi:hypothetical protein
MASLESELWDGMHRALVSSSTPSPRSNTAAAPIPEPAQPSPEHVKVCHNLHSKAFI